jgi:hypothetical protein
MTDQDDRKLAPNFILLFAAAALGVALALPHVAPSAMGHSIKSGAAVFGIVFAACAVGGSLLSRTGMWRAIGAFLLVGVIHTVYWFVRVHSAGAESGGSVANALGTAVAIKLAISFGGASIAGGIGGSIFAQKVRTNIKKTAAALATRR